MKRRIISIVTALAMCLSFCPAWVFAAGPEPDTGLCSHHLEHIDCGYIAPTEGQPCGHEHTDECCTIGEDGGEVLDCQHTHNSDCGYVQADPGQPCGYECRLCPIEDLLAALPRRVTEDNAEAVRWQLDEVLALYTELSEDEQDQIDLSSCRDLQWQLEEASVPMTAAGVYQMSSRRTINSGNLSTYNNAVFTGTTTSNYLTIDGVAVHLTIRDLDLQLPHSNEDAALMYPGINLTNNATLYLTLEGTNTIKGGNMYPAIQVPEGCKLVITRESTGSLNALSGYGAAGIGSSWGGSTVHGIKTLGSIEINGGELSAVGTSGGAGIGGTANCSTGSITITGGTVYAEGGSKSEVVDGMTMGYGGAGIGGGYLGFVPNITITGGNVTAKAGNDTAACIGAGTSGYGTVGTNQAEFRSGDISITGGTIKTEGATALGHNYENGAPILGNIVLSTDATLLMAGDIRPMPQDWERYTFTGSVFDMAITSGQTSAALIIDGKAHDVTINQNTAQPYYGTFSFRTFFPKRDSVEAGLVCGGNTYHQTGSKSGTTFSFTFGRQAYAYYSLDITIYDETITANMNAEVSVDGVTTSAALVKTAEYCGRLQITRLLLPIEAKDRSSDVTVTAGGHTWTGAASKGTAKTLTIGSPIQPAEMVFDLYYGDVTFEKIGDYVQVTYTGPDAVEAATVFLTDLSKVYEVIQSSADTPTGHRLMIKNTTDPVHLRIKNINIKTTGNSDSPIQLTGGKAVLETSGTNTVTASGQYAAAVYVKEDSELTLTGTGTLTAKSTNGYSGAGIGGLSQGTRGTSSGTITIQSGTIIAESARNGAGIGGGDSGSGTVAINGGTVTATGNNGGAGIGGGSNGKGTVTINGGTVTACGNGGGCGIGGGYGGKGAATVLITGGIVTAETTYQYGCGIGSGQNATAAITITGGTIKADAPEKYTSGIGGGFNGSATVTITGGTIQASGQRAVVQDPKNDRSVGLQLVTIALDGVGDDVPVTGVDGVGGYGLQDVYTRDGGKLYFYLPAETLPERITADGVDYVPDGEGSRNYVVDFTVEFKGYALNKVYDGNALAYPTAAQVISNSVYGDLTFAWYQGGVELANPPANAGDYVLRVSSDKGVKEFEALITKRPLTITAEAQAIDYQTTIAQEEYTQSGLAAGDSLAVTLATDKTAPGTYTGGITAAAQITRGGVDVTGNYEITSNPGDLTINKIAPTVSSWPAAAAITYGQALNESSLTGGDPNGTFAWKDGSTKPEQAGQFSYDVVFTPSDPNYAEVTQKVFVTVGRAALTITANAQTITYGGSIDTSASAVTAVLAAGDTLSAVTVSATGKDAGTYPGGITAAGAEIKRGDTDVTENYTISYESGDLTINRKTITPTIVITPSQYEYTGSQIKPGEDAGTSVQVLDSTVEILGSEYTLSYGENTHVGSGSVTVTDSGSGNYAIMVTTQNFTITKKLQAALSITGKPGSTAYGDTFTLTTDGGSGDGTVTWTVTSGSATVSASGEVKITGVGSVEIKAVKGGGADYEDAEATLTFEAARKPVTATVTAQSKTYDGTTTATVTAAVTDSNLVSGDSITISGLVGTFSDANVGEGKPVTVDSSNVTITGTNAENYIVTFPNATASISKADAAITTVPTAQTLIYTGAAQALVTAGSANVGNVVYSLTETGTYSATIPTGTNAGDYTVWYKVEGTDNYNGTEPMKVDVNIAKADYSGIKTANTSAKFGTAVTYDLSVLLPDGATAGTPATASGIFEGTPSVSGKTLTYKLKADAVVGGTGNITVPVTSTNYEDFSLTVTVTVTYKDVPTLTISPITVNYTGEPVTIQGNAKVGDTTVSGIWAFAGDKKPTTVEDSGTYQVNFTPDEPEIYAPATATVTVTIAKAEVSLTLAASPSSLTSGGSVTLTLSGLPDGGLAAVTCSDEGITVELGEAANTWIATLPSGTANYTFTAAYAGDANHVKATATCSVKVGTSSSGSAPSSPGSSYEPFSPTTPSTPTLPVNTTGQNSPTVTSTTTAAPTASTSGGTAATTVNTTIGNEIVKQAVANNSEDVVIAPKVTGNVTKMEVSIPASTVGQIGSQTNAKLTIATPVAEVTIPNGGLGSLSSAGGTVNVTAEKVGNTVELSVTAGGKAVESIPGGVTVTVPVSDTTPGTVAVLVHEDGTREVVRKSVADGDSVTIPLDGSAKLEIVDNSKQFADVPSTSWAADAVAFASAHELFNGTGANQFSPDLPMSRGMLAVVLHNLENNPEQTLSGVFSDVDSDKWYAEGIAWAASNGIVGGYGNGQFGPDDNITREQLAVMLWRYAGSPAAADKELDFSDADKASDWALEALRWAAENGVLNGYGDGRLDPKGLATRAQMAQMLKNYMEAQKVNF